MNKIVFALMLVCMSINTPTANAKPKRFTSGIPDIYFPILKYINEHAKPIYQGREKSADLMLTTDLDDQAQSLDQFWHLEHTAVFRNATWYDIRIFSQDMSLNSDQRTGQLYSGLDYDQLKGVVKQEERQKILENLASEPIDILSIDSQSMHISYNGPGNFSGIPHEDICFLAQEKNILLCIKRDDLLKPLGPSISEDYGSIQLYILKPNM